MPGAVHGAARRPTGWSRGSAPSSTTGDPDGEITETGGSRPSPLELPTGRILPAPARLLGDQGGRRARLPAGPARREGRAAGAGGDGVSLRAARGGTGDRAEFEIECSSGTYVRSLVADLGDAYCESLRRHRDRAVLGGGGGRSCRCGCAGPAARGAREGFARPRVRPAPRRRHRLPRDEHQGHPTPGCRTASRGTSRSAPSTASMSATGR